MQIVDSHCHLNKLDFVNFGGNIESVIAHAKELSVIKFLCVCIDLEHFDEVLFLAKKYPQIYASVGVHPVNTKGKDPSICQLLKLANYEEVIAIGETGLDYFHIEKAIADWQRNRFRRHIRASNQSGKPMIIHTRNAKEDTIKIMQEEKAKQGVMHCFSEDWETAQMALDLGFYISFSGIITFRSAKDLREVAKKVPSDKLLVETDSPYLTPMPYRGASNLPAYSYYVVEKLAEIRGVSINDIACTTTSNFEQLFNMNTIFQTIDEFSQGQRLDNYLFKTLKGVPKSHIYRVIRKGEVRVNKGRKKSEYKLNLDDIVRIPPIKVSTTKFMHTSYGLKKILTNSILYEDKGLLIINKPSDLAVHSGSGVNVGVIEALRQMYKEPIELVHRLDSATSGVLLVAKKRLVLKNLHEQLNQHTIEKNYIGLVKGVWSKKLHTIDAPLYNNSRYTKVDAKGKYSVSHFHPLKNFSTDNFAASLVNISIETGRTHQIRVHAKYAGHALAYDNKYGDKEFDRQVKFKGLKRLFLHSNQLIFINPLTSDIQKVNAPLPVELEDFLVRL